MLRELEAALMAMPAKRLIAGSLCREGETCAVGELAVYRRMQAGAPRAEALAWLEGLALGPGDETGNDTAEFGVNELGLTFVLAWELAYMNDERAGWSGLTPEYRYDRVLDWVRAEIGKVLS